MKLKAAHPVTYRSLYTIYFITLSIFTALNGDTRWALVGLSVADGIFTLGPALSLSAAFE